MLDDSLKNSTKKVVGLKQTRRALERGTVYRVYLAKNSDAKILQSLEEQCRQLQVEIVEVPTMAELGKVCGIQVGTAVAALLKE